MKTFFINGAALTLVLFSLVAVKAGTPRRAPAAPQADTIKTEDILSTLYSDIQLLYPLGTSRIYKANNYRSVWFSSQSGTQVWDALMLLDGSIQYGLNRHDYHSNELVYSEIGAGSAGRDLKTAARLDVLLTDAMLAFISHLRYGRLAPFYTASTTDQADFQGLRADSLLLKALNSGDFYEVVLSAQPGNTEYKKLQNMLRLLAGQYSGDSFDTSIESIKLIGINLERLRWENPTVSMGLLINIPSFTLQLNQPGRQETFKIISGKASSQTPLLSGTIDYLITAPDLTLPQKFFLKELLPLALKYPDFFEKNNYRLYDKEGNAVSSDPGSLRKIKENIAAYVVRQSPGCDGSMGEIAFHFANNAVFYIHDWPQKAQFELSERALSKGCIAVEKPARLARLLIAADSVAALSGSDFDRALIAGRQQKFLFSTPIKVRIMYLTCTIEDGILQKYPDIYEKDKALIEKLYGPHDLFIGGLTGSQNRVQEPPYRGKLITN